MSDIFSRISNFISPKSTAEQTARTFLASSDSQFPSVAKPTGLNIAVNCDLLQQPSNGMMLPKMNPCLLIANGSYSHSYPKCYNNYYLPIQNFKIPILQNIDQFCVKTMASQMQNKTSKKSVSQTNLFSCETMAFNFMPEWRKSSFEPKKLVKKTIVNDSAVEYKSLNIEKNTMDSTQKTDSQKETIDSFKNRDICSGKQMQMCGNAIINHILGFGDDDSEYESDCDETSLPPTDTEYYSSSESENDEDCIWEQITSCRKPWTCDRKFRDKKSLSFTTSSYESSDETECSDNEEDVIENVDQSARIYENKTDSSSDESDSESIDKEPQVELSSTSCNTSSTVKRPKCSNDKISFILGGDTSDSEAEGEFQQKKKFFHQDSMALPITEMKSGENNRSNATDHCELWDYFIKLHEPFVEKVSVCFKSEKKGENVPSNSNNCLQVEESLPWKPSVVRFDDKVIEHPMIAWSFAYKKARKGEWETFARDRERFKSRILNVERDIGWCFDKDHRNAVFDRISMGPEPYQ